MLFRQTRSVPWWRAAVLVAAALMAPSAGARELPDFSALVRAQGSVVVNISTTQQVRNAAAPMAEEDAAPLDPLWHFRQETAPQGNNASLGSGLIFSTDGHIVTCAHVVDGARDIVVRLKDRREFSARLVGIDRRSDIALLKIEATRLPQAVIGDAHKLKVGEWVLAIGSPFGFASSATAGIVSAKGRSLPQESYLSFIQTDVAINPGSSGGPLFNLKGEVVGINSRIYTATTGYSGVSFAIPIDTAVDIAGQLRRDGRVRRGWLGISLQEVSGELAHAYGLEQPRGALIADILPEGPAARSELQIGDVVLEFENRVVEHSSELAPLVGRTAPGTRARLKVFRRGEGTVSVSAMVAELREGSAAVAAAQSRRRLTGSTPAAKAGLVITELLPVQRDARGLIYGVSVAGVEEGVARDAGMLPGDIILEVEGKRVRGVSEFNRLAAQAPRERPAVFRIRRGAQSLFVALRLPE